MQQSLPKTLFTSNNFPKILWATNNKLPPTIQTMTKRISLTLAFRDLSNNSKWHNAKILLGAFWWSWSNRQNFRKLKWRLPNHFSVITRSKNVLRRHFKSLIINFFNLLLSFRRLLHLISWKMKTLKSSKINKTWLRWWPIFQRLDLLG